jgi:hypothetical protein
VYRDYRVEVKRQTLVVLGIEGKGMQGAVTLAAEMPSERVRDVEIAQDAGDATYGLRDSPAQPGVLELYVVRGGLLVDWARGNLRVIAGKVVGIISGTKLTVAVDSTADRTFVFVESGHMLLPALDTALSSGDVLQVDRSDSKISRLTQSESRLLAQSLDRALVDPFAGDAVVLASKGSSIPAIAAAGGGVLAALGIAAVLAGSGGKSKDLPGTVEVTIP